MASYSPPSWSTTPTLDFSLEVVKDGSVVETIPLRKAFLIVGRQDDCDIPLLHLSVSRRHAALQFGESSASVSHGTAVAKSHVAFCSSRRDNCLRRWADELYLCDLGSTHGTTLNKERIAPHAFKPVPVGSTIVFGSSSRKFVVQGPEEMEPQEQETERQRRVREQSEARQERKRKERAERKRNRQPSGATWGIADDAPEDDAAEQESRDFLSKTLQAQESGSSSSGGPELSEDERAIIDRLVRAQRRKRQLGEEVARIESKRSVQQGELGAGQWEQLERHESALEKLEIDIEELEEEFQDARRAKSRRGTDYRRNLDVRDEMEAEAVEFTGNAWDDDSEEDEGDAGDDDVGRHLRDRARGKRGRGMGAAASAGGRKFTIVTGGSKHVTASGGARSTTGPSSRKKKQARPSEHWTAASLEARLRLLEQERRSLEETIAKGESASASQPAASEDGMDAFLQEADREQQINAAKKAKEELGFLDEEVSRLQRLHELARPALEGLESHADRELRLRREKHTNNAIVATSSRESEVAIADDSKGALASEDTAAIDPPPRASAPPTSPPRSVKRPRPRPDTKVRPGTRDPVPVSATEQPPPPKRHRPAATEVEPSEDVVTWQPPKGQKGDGRTSLNDILGY